MYTTYFGLNESPFSIAPDPRYLYMSMHHREALAHLLYGVRSDGGFVLLTGEIGAGKTTLCRRLLGQLPEDVDVAFVLNPKVTVIELLETVCDELRITQPDQPTVKNLVDRLNAFLLEANARGRKTVLIIDEAQNLSMDVLEQLRLLTNLETDRRKLLQIVLLGQPELRLMLSRPELQQLAQRVTARYHLGPLGQDEIADYVHHRLGVAGCDRQIFQPKSIRRLWQKTGGVPRLINLVCDRSLLGAYARERQFVDADIVQQAAHEVIDDLGQSDERRSTGWVIAAVLLIACGAGFGLWTWHQQTRQLPEPVIQQSATVDVPRSQAAPVQENPSPADGRERVAVAEAVAAPPLDADSELPQTWPATFGAGQSRDRAFSDLAALWGLENFSATRAFCSTAAEVGLRCLARQDSLEQLRQLDRPAILTLYADDGTPFYVVLSGLEGDMARFVTGNENLEVDIAALQTRWFGEFLILWREPENLPLPLQPGEAGAGVLWLARTLEELGRYRMTGREAGLEGQLLGALKRFQFSSGLAPDGVLGPLTMIHLNSARQTPGPRLRAERAG